MKARDAVDVMRVLGTWEPQLVFDMEAIKRLMNEFA
jgi:hypothetical protein